MNFGSWTTWFDQVYIWIVLSRSWSLFLLFLLCFFAHSHVFGCWSEWLCHIIISNRRRLSFFDTHHVFVCIPRNLTNCVWFITWLHLVYFCFVLSWSWIIIDFWRLMLPTKVHSTLNILTKWFLSIVRNISWCSCLIFFQVSMTDFLFLLYHADHWNRPLLNIWEVRFILTWSRILVYLFWFRFGTHCHFSFYIRAKFFRDIIWGCRYIIHISHQKFISSANGSTYVDTWWTLFC